MFYTQLLFRNKKRLCIGACYKYWSWVIDMNIFLCYSDHKANQNIPGKDIWQSTSATFIKYKLLKKIYMPRWQVLPPANKATNIAIYI